MKGTHGSHKANRFTFPAITLQCFLQPGYGMNDLHLSVLNCKVTKYLPYGKPICFILADKQPLKLDY